MAGRSFGRDYLSITLYRSPDSIAVFTTALLSVSVIPSPRPNLETTGSEPVMQFFADDQLFWTRLRWPVVCFTFCVNGRASGGWRATTHGFLNPVPKLSASTLGLRTAAPVAAKELVLVLENGADHVDGVFLLDGARRRHRCQTEPDTIQRTRGFDSPFLGRDPVRIEENPPWLAIFVANAWAVACRQWPSFDRFTAKQNEFAFREFARNFLEQHRETSFIPWACGRPIPNDFGFSQNWIKTRKRSVFMLHEPSQTQR